MANFRTIYLFIFTTSWRYSLIYEAGNWEIHWKSYNKILDIQKLICWIHSVYIQENLNQPQIYNINPHIQNISLARDLPTSEWRFFIWKKWTIYQFSALNFSIFIINWRFPSDSRNYDTVHIYICECAAHINTYTHNHIHSGNIARFCRPWFKRYKV